MPLDISAIDAVNDKKFTEFSKAVKQELKQKMSSHEVTKKYVSDYDKIQQMKASFASITATNDEVDKVDDKVDDE